MVLSIISNNCWGSEYYKEQKIEYNTPFVGLFVEPDDYLALLANFRVALGHRLINRIQIRAEASLTRAR